MAYRLYIDTSVFGALFDAEDKRRVDVTQALLRRLRHAPFAPYVGTPLLEEVSRAPEGLRARLEHAVDALQPTLLEEDALSLALAQAYVEGGVLLPKDRGDARHLALASVAGLDAVVSWNFRHMVNLQKKRLVHSVNARMGYHLVDIISPLEVPDA